MPIMRIPYGVLDGRYVNANGDSMLGNLTVPSMTIGSLTGHIKGTGGALSAIPSISSATYVVAASNSINKDKADYICDGIDDQLEIKAAIDALPDSGGRVLLLEGTYYINNNILISDLENNNYVTLEGQGMGTVLKVPNGNNVSPMYVIYAYGSSNTLTGIQIRNLRIDGNRSNVTGSFYDGVAFVNVTNSIIDGVYVSNGKGNGTGDGYGFWLNNCTDITIENCVGRDWDFEPMEIRDSSRITVTDCRLEMRIELYETVDNVVFSNNMLYNCMIFVGTNIGSGNYADYILIANNYFYIDASMISGLNIGINLVRSRYASIVGNVFYTNYASTTCINSSYAPYSLISGNSFINLGSSNGALEGIFVENTITGNRIYSASSGHGITLNNTSTGTIIRNNVFQKASGGSWGTGLTLYGGANGCIVENNQFTNWQTTGLITASNSNIIRNNRFTNNVVAINNTGSSNIFSQNIGAESFDTNFGIGTSGPDRKLDVLDASNPQLRLTHTDGTKYTDFQTDTNGDLIVTPSGGDLLVAGNLAFVAANRPTEIMYLPVADFQASQDGSDNNITVYLASDRTNYRNYIRYAGLSDSQDMDMDLESRLPDTYASFTGSGSLSIDVRASDYANCQVTLTMWDADGNVDATINAYNITPTANNTWQTKTVEPGSTYVAGEGIFIRVRVISLDTSDTVDISRVKLSYKALR